MGHALNPCDKRSANKCKYYMEGSCLKLNCPFLHDPLQLCLRPPNDEWDPLPYSHLIIDEGDSDSKSGRSSRAREKSPPVVHYISDNDEEEEPDDFTNLLHAHLNTQDPPEESLSPIRPRPP